MHVPIQTKSCLQRNRYVEELNIILSKCTGTEMETEITINHEGDKDNFIEFEVPISLLQYLSSEECYLQNICRICLSTSNEVMYPLFSNKEYSAVAAMFQTTTSIHVSL